MFQLANRYWSDSALELKRPFNPKVIVLLQQIVFICCDGLILSIYRIFLKSFLYALLKSCCDIISLQSLLFYDLCLGASKSLLLVMNSFGFHIFFPMVVKFYGGCGIGTKFR